MALPEAETPEMQTPETQTPVTQTPQAQTLVTQAPETETPETQTSETEITDMKTIKTETPETETLEIETPETETLETQTLETQTLETQALVTQTPETETPETKIADADTELNYAIRVATSEKYFSGTNDQVKMQIIGSDHETEPIVLNTPRHDDFEKGRTDNFEIKSIDLGEALGFVKLKFKNNNSNYSKGIDKPHLGRYVP